MDETATWLADMIREAIDRSGRSWYSIARETGISNQTLSRFMNGERYLTMDNAARVMHALGFTIKPPKPAAPDARRRVGATKQRRKR